MKRVTDTRYGDTESSYSSYSTQYSMTPSTAKIAQDERIQRELESANKVGNITTGSCSGATGCTYGVVEKVQTVLTDTSEPLISDRSNCRFASSTYYMRHDVAYIPITDYFGNSVTGSYYTGLATFTSGSYNGYIRPDKPVTLRQAAANATDSAAIRIRSNSTLDPVIYTIGLGNPSDPTSLDQVLLRRLANDPDSPIFDDTVMQECTPTRRTTRN